MGGSDPWDFSKYVDVAGSESTSSPQGQATGSTGGSTPYSAPLQQDEAVSSWNDDARPVTLTISGPPVQWLLAATAAAIVSGAIAGVWGENISLAIAAWALAGPIAIGLLAGFTTVDTRRRSQALYAARGWVKPAYIACLTLCGLAVLVSSFRIALWVSSR